MKKIVLLSVSIALVIGLNACRTGKKAFESGNYYQSVLLSVDKLRSSPKNKKAQETLVEAYPLAVQTLELNNENLLKSNDASKWKLILANYTKINNMYEQILRSPVALKLIGTPKNYYAEIENVKKKAAEETYALAFSYLIKGNREDAKKAYYLFQESQSYIANYKDTNDKMEEARIMATLFVMINQDPVPANFAVSGSHFKNKIDEYLHSAESRMDFVEFYNPEEMIALGIQPTHEVVLRYQDFSIGNVFFKESTEHLTKDSVIVASYTREKSGTKGSVENTNIQFSSVESGSMTMNAKPTSESKKVIICHKANGNQQTLEVNVNALQAHLNHGDTMGACDSNSGSTGNTGTPTGTSTGTTGTTESPGTTTGSSGTSGSTGSTGTSAGTTGNTTGNTGNTTGTSGNTGNTGNTTNTSGTSGNTSGTGTSGNTGTATGTTGSTTNTSTTTGTSGDTGTVSGTSGNLGNTGNTKGTSGNTGTATTSANPNTPTEPITEVVNVYATVKATLVVNEKTLTSNALMSMTIYETDRAGRVIKEELFPVEHIWTSKWGYFNGDERALSPEQLEITKQKELAAPTRDEIFMLLSEDFYYKVTENIRAFYKNY